MGLKVGHILSVDFAADDPNKVQILFAVDDHIPVTESSYAQLATQGIAGLKTLNLSNPNPKAKPLKTDSTHPANVPLHQALLSHFEDSGQQTMQKINNILNSAQQLLNKNNRQHLAQTIAHIDKASRQMQLAIAKIDRLTTQAQGPVAQAGQVEDSVQSLSNSADRLTRRLNDHTLPRIDGLISTLNQTAHHLDQLSQELATKPNSVIMGPPKARPGPGEPGFAK